MKKRILALILSLCLLLVAAPVSAGAATGQQVSANAVSVVAGNGVTVTLKAENFQNIAALDVDVYYDPTVLTLSDTSNGSMLSGTQSSVNTATPGEVKLSFVSLNGLNGNGTLLTIRFTTASTCPEGTYPVTVAVGRAYDATFAPAQVNATSGSVTVNKPVATEKFTVYTYVDNSTLQTGDVLSVRLANGGSRPFVSGEFTFTYDANVFAYEDLVWESAMTDKGAVYSVNSSVPGSVRVAYANDKPVSCFYMMTLKLKVTANKSGSFTVGASATNIYREDLTLYQPASYSNSVKLVETAVEEEHPDVYFETETLIVGENGASVLYLEEGANVAAADFTLTYDPTVLSCLGVENLTEEIGGMVVLNDNYKEGTIRFSYINQTPVGEKTAVVKLLWQPLTAEHYTLTALAEGAVDIKYNKLTLDHPEATGCIYLSQRTEPTCEGDGSITYTCSCGNTLETVVLPTVHPWDEGVYTAPTYEADGYTTYTCQSCGRTKTEADENTMLQPAEIFHHPEAVTAESGESVTFHVEASNTAVAYKWEYRKIYKWFSTTMDGFDTHTLTVPAAGSRDGYDYRCTVIFADGTVLISEMAELTVNTYITDIQNPNDQTVVLGYKGQFTAGATGEGIKYQWQYKRPDGERWIDTAMEGATKQTVYIESTTGRDGYQYRCSITDVTGKTVYTEPATMRVLSFKSHPKDVVVATGKIAKFTVTTSVDSGFTYQWQYSRNGGSSWTNTTMEGYNTATLSVAATMARYGYMYRCVLTGSKNSKITSGEAALQVVEPVKITSQPKDVTTTSMENAVFTVAANNVVSYRWQYRKADGTKWYDTTATGYNTATLTVAAKGKNGYRYRCVLTGLDGTEVLTEVAGLTVQ